MAEGSRMSRGWRIVLILSLALNVAVIGAVAGLALRVGRDGPPARYDLALGPIGQALSSEDKRAVGRELRRNPALRDGRPRADRVAAQALVDALRQDVVSEAALRAALDAPAQRIDQIREAAQTALVNRLMAMSPDDRAALADRIEAAAKPSRR